MSKYIDRSKVNDEIVRVLEHTDCKGEYIDRVLRAIESIPTIDIVHCKDCEYFKLHESVFGKGWICKRNHVVVGSVDFCSYGERIEE